MRELLQVWDLLAMAGGFMVAAIVAIWFIETICVGTGVGGGSGSSSDGSRSDDVDGYARREAAAERARQVDWRAHRARIDRNHEHSRLNRVP